MDDLGVPPFKETPICAFILLYGIISQLTNAFQCV